MNYEDRDYIERISATDVHNILSDIHGDRYKQYRENWNEVEKKEGFVPDAPLQIIIELSNKCNLKCKNCARNINIKGVSRSEQSLEQIKNITEQCRKLNVPTIALGLDDEPTMHTQFYDIVRLLNGSCIDLWVYTNGLNLSKEMAEFFVEQQVERLLVSIDAATAETYNEVRGGNFQLLEENINRFLEIRESQKSKLPFLRLSFVKMQENIAEIPLFIKKWENKADIIDFQDLIDYTHVDDPQPIEYEPFVCTHPSLKLVIDYEGNILPCCGFYCRHHKIGNIADMTLEEAWNSPKIKNLRASFHNGKVYPTCQNCYGNLSFRNNLAESMK